MADVLTVAPGTPLEQVLNDNARMTPESMSKADAQAAGEKADVLRQDAERIIQQALSMSPRSLRRQQTLGDVATDNADFLFTPAIDLGRSKDEIAALKAQAAAKKRNVGVLTFSTLRRAKVLVRFSARTMGEPSPSTSCG